jgi:hypothetical protein
MRIQAVHVAALAMALAACTSNPNNGSAPADQSKPAAAVERAPAPAAPPKPEPAPPPAPRFRDVELPTGTALSLTLATSVASDTSRAEEPIRATLAKPVLVDGSVVLPTGSEVKGLVVSAEPSGRVKGRASIAIRFDRVSAWNDEYRIRTATIAREAEATKKEDATKIAIGAGAGAVVGAIAGGKKGAAIGTAVGGGAGTGVVMATRGKEVSLGTGATVTARLQEPITVRVPVE